MLRSVIIQDYSQGIACDASGNRNHGIPVDVTYDAGNPQQGFDFATGDSRISINPSASLNDLTAILAGARFSLQPGEAAHRYNLAEGYLSFSLYISPDLALNGTIYDAKENWTGVASAPGICTPNSWHTASLTHDGASTLTLTLDGTAVAQTSNAIGPVRSVGNLGIAVGHWPNPESAYTFEGNINYFQLLKHSPQSDFQSLLDPCCADLGPAQDLARRLSTEGVTLKVLGESYQQFLSAGLSSAASVIGGDSARARTLTAIATSLAVAVARGDGAAMDQLVARGASLSKSWGGGDPGEIELALAKVLKATKIKIEDLRTVLDGLCMKQLASRSNFPRTRKRK
jgi:hypothetical protein